MFKALKNIFPNSPFAVTKYIIVTSLPQRSPSPLKHRFPSRNQRPEHYYLNYPITGTKEDSKDRKPPTSNSYENAGRRQHVAIYDYSNIYITATSPEYRLQMQFSSPTCFPSSVKKNIENISPDCNEKEDLSNDLLSHCLQVTTGPTNSNRNTRGVHRIPTGPPPSPPREPTYPPTCPPSLAPPCPGTPSNPYSKPRPVFLPEYTRERCDVPVCPPYTVYPVQPPSVTSPCPPLVNPLKNVHLPKRKPKLKPKAQRKVASSFQAQVCRQAQNFARHHFHYCSQHCPLRLLPLITLVRFVR